MQTRYFEDFELEETYETQARTITEANQVNYAGLSGNFHPVHLDKERMERSSYGYRMVNGFLVVSMMGLKIQSGLLDDSVVALAGVEDISFERPIPIGETIHSELTVMNLTERDEETGIIRLREAAVNQDGEEVVVAETTTIVHKRQ